MLRPEGGSETLLYLHNTEIGQHTHTHTHTLQDEAINSAQNMLEILYFQSKSKSDKNLITSK